jgi:alkaline phosphatase D
MAAALWAAVPAIAAAQQQPAAAPYGGPFLPLPAAEARLSRIAIGSCSGSERPIPILSRIAAEQPDLYIYAGDNVYGDARANDPTLPELRTAYAQLAASPHYAALRAAAPILAVWDDHDYGLNDAGVEFFAKNEAKTLFERFWESGERLAGREGVYDAHSFGPEGQRVQILLLDTRWSRTALARMSERGPRGVYAQTRDPQARMLSEQQWNWLEARLREPAALRVIVSSVQVLADGHDFEGWDNMPLEQQRLFDLIKRTEAKGVVFVSGDRHSAGLYRREGLLPYTAIEMTASALNRSSTRINDEVSTGQLGSMYSLANYGMLEIDWDKRAVTLQVRDATGLPVRSTQAAFAEIGVR